GMVLFLPHGYEGQGPEHSSARLERFLQLCAEDNIQVAVPTTPAQHFHLLRRQLKRNFRKPLVVMTPKSLLRAENCASTVAELVKGHFREVIGDPAADPAAVRRVILCTGKVYYDLLKYRADKKITDAAIVRLEQPYPFPERQLRDALAAFTGATHWVWAQEESHNNGAWFFVEPRLRQLGFDRVAYVGRDASASPATGSHSVHTREQAELIEAAFTRPGGHLVRAPSFRSVSATAMAAATESHKNGHHTTAQAGPVTVQQAKDKTPAAPAAG
ncbi:MAG: 2-oxoglutarate dehydrogenase E1 component, partial [Gemmataceae bacterium]